MGRLDEFRQAVIDEHLLVCATCQLRLDEVEVFALAMQRAIATEPALQPEKTRRLKSLWRWPAAVGFAAVILTIILGQPSDRNRPPLASIQLTAIRGELPSVERAEETRIALTDAPVGTQLRVEVVDATGTKVSDSLRITKPLAEGSYFVRLYDDAGELLHEYGFRIR